MKRQGCPGSWRPAAVHMCLVHCALQALQGHAQQPARRRRSARGLCAGAGRLGAHRGGTLRHSPRTADCARLLELHSEGYEIALQALNPTSLLNLSKPDIAAEVTGGRARLAACGIPATDVVGLRAPGLESKPEVRQVASEARFVYDRCARCCLGLVSWGQAGQEALRSHPIVGF